MAAPFIPAAIYTDVKCNGGDLVTSLTRRDLAALVADLSVKGRSALTCAVWRRSGKAEELIAGRVIRVNNQNSPLLWEEWRIGDDEVGSDDTAQVVKCSTITEDLKRAFYVSISASGIPSHLINLPSTTATALLDGPVRDALDAAGLTYLVTGSVDAEVEARTFALAGTFRNAREMIDAARADGKAGGDLVAVRNGETDYEMNWVTALGASAPRVQVRTRSNLYGAKRRRFGSELTTRIVPYGKENGAARGISHAPWVVKVKNTAGANYIDVGDIRGTPYYGAARLPDQYNLKYAVLLDITHIEQQITDTVIIDNETTRLFMSDASDFDVGRWLHIQNGTGADGERMWGLDHPAAQLLHAGVHTRFLERGELTGAVNLAPNPLFRTWANPSNPPDGWTKYASLGTVTGSQDSVHTNDLGGTCYRLQVTASGGGHLGGARGPEVRIRDGVPWRIWVLIYIANAPAPLTGSVTVCPRFESDDSAAAAEFTFDNSFNGTYNLRSFDITDTEKGGDGIYPDVGVQSVGGGSGQNVDVTIVGWGVQPGEWTRTDTYGPDACDLVHEGNRFLVDDYLPTQFDVVVADLYLHNKRAHPFRELVLGGTLDLYVTDLSIRTDVRFMDGRRNYLRPLDQMQLTLGRPRPQVAAAIKAQSRTVDQGIVAETALAIGNALVEAGATVTGKRSTLDDLGDAPSTGADLLIGTGILIGEAFTKKTGRLRVPGEFN